MSSTRFASKTTQLSQIRLGLILAAFLIALLALGGRAIWLQVVETHALKRVASNQQQNLQTLPAVRGGILDRNGYELAIGEEATTFYATPYLLKDRAGTALQISKALKLNKREEENLVQRLTQATGGFAYVARQVSREKAAKVEALKLPGIDSYPEESRWYPNKIVAGQILGAVDIDNKGIEGIEAMYDKSLTGTPGEQLVVRDPNGVAIDVLKIQPERDGRDVHLTIDSVIQQEAERILRRTVSRTSATSATAIVMDIRTGKILTMANTPAANPAAWSKMSGEQRRNRAITDIYEPGSTLKIVAISGALEDGTVTPSTTFELPPKLTFCDDEKTCTVKDAHARGTVWMTVRDILVESSNIGTIRVAQSLGATPQARNQRLDYWMKRFGFGSQTGIDFPGESPGLMTPVEQWSKVSIGNIPIGQGISVTPIQLISAYSTIANGGVFVQPQLLERIGDETPVRPVKKRVISEKTARTMRNMFEGVVQDERGTGTAAEIKHYKVGGKTGTAEMPNPNGGGYLKGRYNSSFVGFVPANNPKLATLVVVNDTPMYGGDAAAPAFEQITEFALKRLAIPPDGRT